MLCMESLSLSLFDSRYVSVRTFFYSLFIFHYYASPNWFATEMNIFLVFRKETHKILAKVNTHQQLIASVFVKICWWMMLLLLLLLSLERIHTLHSLALPAACVSVSLLLNELIYKSQRQFNGWDFCFHLLSMNEFVTQKKKWALFPIRFVKFVLAFDMLCYELNDTKAACVCVCAVWAAYCVSQVDSVNPPWGIVVDDTIWILESKISPYYIYMFSLLLLSVCLSLSVYAYCSLALSLCLSIHLSIGLLLATCIPIK